MSDDDNVLSADENAAYEKMIKGHLTRLSEHFDNIQIFVSRNPVGECKNTISFRMGHGNHFARYGHIKDWILEWEATNDHNVIQED